MAKATKTPSIRATKNYRLFKRSIDNRDFKPKEHRKLLESMKRKGFLRAFPIICERDDKGDLVVKDGQHRLAFAETLGLSVYFIVDDSDFDIAFVNSTAKPWKLRDYAEKYARNGVAAYQEGMEFAEIHRLPLGIAFSLLAGTVVWQNVKDDFESGEFKIKDREWADAVASTYSGMLKLSEDLKRKTFIEACMAACRVSEFDSERLLQNAKRCREKLSAYSTRDANLDLLEEVYNFGRKQLFGLKAAATMAMRDRSAVAVKSRMKAEKNGKH